MTDHGTPQMTDSLRAIAAQHPHVDAYVREFREAVGEYPLYVEECTKEHQTQRPNVLYPAEAPAFVHCYGDVGVTVTYTIVEPELLPEEQEAFDGIRIRLLEKSGQHPLEPDEDFGEHLNSLLESIVDVSEGKAGGFSAKFGGKVKLSRETFDRIQYRLMRDIVGLGPLDAIMKDPLNEDIHVIGPHETFTVHGIYGMVETSVDFGEGDEFEDWLRNLGERMDNPMSDSRPIVDATMPDGSRINVIYSDDVSIKGPSLTIRQGIETPLSVLQLVDWGTLSPELAAYLWLCLENNRSVFVVGETASGKTTTLNAILAFIPREAKIYTAEDTAEVLPPHATWQQLLTRKGSGDGSTDVTLFDLVAAALRSRPDYIIVGEVRGAEAQMAFQAAQTGHPVMLTFHASNVVAMIQRFTSAPISIPEAFMNNCDVALFQNRVKRGDTFLRRVTSVVEIEGYSKEAGGVITREVFNWDPVDDEIVFVGNNNSFVMEEKVASLLGLPEPAMIYDELERRAEICRRLVEADVTEYDDVNKAIDDFQRDGVEVLPIDLAGLTGGVSV